MEAQIKEQAMGFMEFIRERGIVGLAIGFVLCGSIQKVVAAFVTDIVNPIADFFLGSAGGFAKFSIGPFLVWDFLSATIDFLILAAIVYFIFKGLRLDNLEKKKEG